MNTTDDLRALSASVLFGFVWLLIVQFQAGVECESVTANLARNIHDDRCRWFESDKFMGGVFVAEALQLTKLGVSKLPGEIRLAFLKSRNDLIIEPSKKRNDPILERFGLKGGNLVIAFPQLRLLSHSSLCADEIKANSGKQGKRQADDANTLHPRIQGTQS